MEYIIPSDAIAGSIFQSNYLNTTKDFVVSFDYACYGYDESGSEGFCVFFTNTFSETVQYGGVGPGLTYSAISGVTVSDVNALQGAVGGELGIGFDITGNFGSNKFTPTGINSVGVPNSLVIRGSQGDNYPYITSTNDLRRSNYTKPYSIYQQIQPGETPTFKRVRVRVTDYGQRVVVDVKDINDLDFTNYLNYTFTQKKIWPSSVRCCLGFSSGQTINTTFKIKGFNINGIITNSIGAAADAFTYNIDTATLSASIAFVNPSITSFVVGDVLSAVNTGYSITNNIPAVTGSPLINVNPLTGPQGVPYRSGDNYVAITNTF